MNSFFFRKLGNQRKIALLSLHLIVFQIFWFWNISNIHANTNVAPTGILISNTTIQENSTKVWFLYAQDVDDSTHNFSFIWWNGSQDNNLFTMNARWNVSFTASPDFETPIDQWDTPGNNTYSFRVKADDTNGGILEQSFIVSVTNIHDSKPGDITGLKWWYDATDANTLFTNRNCTQKVSGTSKQDVLCWKDKSNTSGHLKILNGTTGKSPKYVYQDSLFNNKSILDFDNNDYLEKNITDIVAPYSYFMVLASDSNNPSTFQSFMSTDSVSNTAGSSQIDYTKDDGGYFRWRSSWKSGSFWPFESKKVKLYWVRHKGVWNDVSLISDGKIVTTINNVTTWAEINKIRINTNRKTQFHHDSRIAEVIFYNQALDSCEIEKMNTYLGNKYGKDFSWFNSSYGFSQIKDVIGALGIQKSECGWGQIIKNTAQSDEVSIFNPNTNNKEDAYLSFANDGVNKNTLSNDVPNGIHKRQLKKWRASQTGGFSSSVSLAFDIDQLSWTANDTLEYDLLVDQDGTFNDANIVASSGTIYNNRVVFENINLAHGDYFALGIRDTKKPSVQINQSSSQTDPNITDSSLLYTLVVDESIQISTLTCSDLTFSGSSNITCGSVSEIAPNDGTTFKVTASADADDTVTVSIAAWVFQDVFWNINNASTSLDNSITINSYNKTPSDISFTRLSIPENTVMVGTGSTVDLDALDTHTYSLVSWTGSQDNNKFNISSLWILSFKSTPDFENPQDLWDILNNNSYAIRVRTTDSSSSNGWFEKEFIVAVTDIDENAPIIWLLMGIRTPSANKTPSFTFTNNEIGNITYGGSCSSLTTQAWVGSNSITLNQLSVGSYTNCTIRVTDTNWNISNTITLPSFTIQNPQLLSSKTNLSINENAWIGNYTLVLDTMPDLNVVVDITSGDLNQATVSPSQITFSSSNWNQVQTISITGVDDSIAANHSVDITAAINTAQSDDNFDAIADNVVGVSLLDDEIPTIILGPQNITTTGLVLEELSGSGKVNFVLGAEPVNPVKINIVSNDTQEVTSWDSQITFSASNWNTPQVVTFTAVDDFIDRNDSSSITVSIDSTSDSAFKNLASQNISINITNDDSKGITLSKNSISVDENAGNGSYTIKLTSQPLWNVVIDVSSSDINEFTLTPTQITFTSLNWNTSQSITITGVDDNIVANHNGIITHSINTWASDSSYHWLVNTTLWVILINDEVATMTIGPGSITTSGISLGEASGTWVFNIVLWAAPVGNVFIKLESLHGQEISILPATSTFTQSNWNIPQIATITAIDDDIDRNDTWEIKISIDPTSDIAFTGIASENVAVTIVDDDTSWFTILPTNTSVQEKAGTGSIVVVLDSQPVGNVVFNILSSSQQEVTLSVSSLTFDASNWNIQQKLIITGVNDDTLWNDTATITFWVDDNNSDDSYDPLWNKVVSITLINDDDAPTGISLNNNTIVENTSNIGELSTTDLSSSDIHQYSLVSGTGSDDNSKFKISGNVISFISSPDFETPTDIWSGSLNNTYTIRVQTSDSSQLTYQEEFIVSVTDVDDTKPIITLIGSSSIIHELNKNYTDSWSTANDNIDGDITVNISINNQVNITQSGSYIVTYDVSDQASNNAIQVIRNVKVVSSAADGDDDGVPDIVEVEQGTDPNDGTDFLDTDGDNKPNYTDGDDDGDGTIDNIENAAPNNWDFNGDGTKDVLQKKVATTVNSVTTKYISLDTNTVWSTCGSQEFNLVWESSLDTQDSSSSYPIGLAKFTLNCTSTGATADIKVILDSQYDTSSWVYKKYNSTTKSYTDMSSIVTYDIENIAGMNKTVVKYSITDGSSYDEDGLANGVIVDPSGPSIAIPKPKSSSWWGSKTTSPIDDCPNGDNTKSRYDRLCEYKQPEIIKPEEKEKPEEEKIVEVIEIDNEKWEEDSNIRSTCKNIEVIQNNSDMKLFTSAYTDISKSQYIDDIKRLENIWVFHSVERKEFLPNSTLTRSEFLATLLKSYCIKITPKGNNVLPFDDSDMNTWQQDVVYTAFKNGIIKWYGSEDNKKLFKPNTPISKIEVITMILRIQNIENTKTSFKNSYIDIEIDWQKQYLNIAEEKNIINAKKTNYNFYPDYKISRDRGINMIVNSIMVME